MVTARARAADKVRKLGRLADRTPYEAEADTARRMAANLRRVHGLSNVDLAPRPRRSMAGVRVKIRVVDGQIVADFA